jgi:hypothetical protein
MACGWPPLKQPNARVRGDGLQGGRLAAVFFALEYPTLYASAKGKLFQERQKGNLALQFIQGYILW